MPSPRVHVSTGAFSSGNRPQSLPLTLVPPAPPVSAPAGVPAPFSSPPCSARRPQAPSLSVFRPPCSLSVLSRSSVPEVGPCQVEGNAGSGMSFQPTPPASMRLSRLIVCHVYDCISLPACNAAQTLPLPPSPGAAQRHGVSQTWPPSIVCCTWMVAGSPTAEPGSSV